MTERRRAVKTEPIVVEVYNGDTFTAQPLYWLDRNELGSEILRQYGDSTNEAIKSFMDESGTPQLSLELNDKLKDPIKVLEMAYPEVKGWKDKRLTWPEILELIFASLEVNSLERLKDLVDPNWSAPEKNGGTSSGEADQTNTQNEQSTPDSDSPDSPTPTLLNSPTTSSPPSSKSGSDSEPQSDTGD